MLQTLMCNRASISIAAFWLLSFILSIPCGDCLKTWSFDRLLSGPWNKYISMFWLCVCCYLWLHLLYPITGFALCGFVLYLLVSNG